MKNTYPRLSNALDFLDSIPMKDDARTRLRELLLVYFHKITTTNKEIRKVLEILQGNYDNPASIGKLGGLTRSRNMSKKQRVEAARKAARARWWKHA